MFELILLLASTTAASLPLTSSTCTGTPSVCTGVLTQLASPPNTIDLTLKTTLGSFSAATGSFQFNSDISTPGPLRTGWMRLTLANDGDWGGGFTSGSVTLGSYACTSGAQIAIICYLNSVKPVTLGSPLALSLSASLSRFESSTGYGGGVRDLYLTAAFFEDDLGSLGLPVTATLAPEPGTCGLAALILLAVVWARPNAKSSK